MLRGFLIFFGVLGLVALTVELYARSRDRSRRQQMELVAERGLLGGGLQGLLHARDKAVGSSAMAGNTEAAATLALASAILTSEYGLDEANVALGAADAVDAHADASPRATALALASRALVAMTQGRADQAESFARRSVDLGHKQASPLYALGRVRFSQGNLPAAAHAFQAALVREPAFVEARVAWAEVWLELGEQDKAKEALLAALQRTPDHSRARLLLAEIPSPPSDFSDWESTCARDEATSPVLASACTLARAHRAWRQRTWDAAVDLAEAAAHRHSVSPRVMGQAAQLLACAGAVDKAILTLHPTATTTNPIPSVRWARLAVDLGKGLLNPVPTDLSPGSSPWAPLLAARIAFATGSKQALDPILTDEKIADLDPPHPFAPIRAYVKGMQARLDGDASSAIDPLSAALARHGDACRAAGEYLAVCASQGRVPDGSAFGWLVENNSQCVNLPAAFVAAEQNHRRASGKPKAPRAR